MRFHPLAAVLIAGMAVPAAAQSLPVERRVDKLEAEMRAVQRKVFPDGPAARIQPEIVPQVDLADPLGAPATSPVADLNARVDALEAQLARLTGQSEENAFKLRQLEENLAKFRADAEFRLNAVEQGGAPAASASPPAASSSNEIAPMPTQTAADTAPADPGEAAYLAGFRMWDSGDFAGAQAALDAMIKKYPKHPRASYAQNLAGRAYLDGGKPATAAKIFLGNYQTNPKGDRAADSLYFLGQALVKLKKPAEACKVYDELADVYGANMRDFIKTRLPKARSDAKCAS